MSIKSKIYSLLGYHNKSSMQTGCYVHPKSIINKWVSIGAYTRINGPAYIVGTNESAVSIGKYCAIGHNLRIRSKNHITYYPNLQNQLQAEVGAASLAQFKKAVTIGHNVWIGDNVTILPGVSIGNGAVIGAGAVVTKDIMAYTINAGLPCKKINDRFPEDVKTILDKIGWWEWSRQRILNSTDFFNIELTSADAIEQLKKYYDNER